MSSLGSRGADVFGRAGGAGLTLPATGAFGRAPLAVAGGGAPEGAATGPSTESTGVASGDGVEGALVGASAVALVVPVPMAGSLGAAALWISGSATEVPGGCVTLRASHTPTAPSTTSSASTGRQSARRSLSARGWVQPWAVPTTLD